METPQLLTRLEQDPDPNDERRLYYLIDRFRKEAIATIVSRPSIIKELNKPHWMKSRGWIYVPQSSQLYAYEINKQLR